MPLLKQLSNIRDRRSLYLLFLLLLMFPGVSAFPAGTREGIELPSLEKRKDLPIFSIYESPTLKIGVPYTHTPNVILAVWKDGYCVWSDNRHNGGPPYKQGTLPQETLFDLQKKLRSFKPPVIKACLVPDSSWKVIAIHDENTSRCIELLSAHEYFPDLTDSRDEGYTQFFKAWKELRRLGGRIDCQPEPSQEELKFDLKQCPPHKVQTDGVAEHVAPDSHPAGKNRGASDGQQDKVENPNPSLSGKRE